jgi:choline kinase
MKLFILAAGTGSRLWPLTKNTPKMLIDLGDGTNLLERQISTAINSKIFNEIVIITGYKAEQIDAKIREYEKALKITTIYNPFYEVSNNLVSLWTAHYKMFEDDFMITNGDNSYADEVMGQILAERPETIQLTISTKTGYDADDMKMLLDPDRQVLRVSKEIDIKEAKAESVGLALIKGKKSGRIFVQKILQLVRQPEYINKFWLEIFNSLIADGVTIKTAEIAKEQWREMDFHPDIELLRKIVQEKMVKA